MWLKFNTDQQAILTVLILEAANKERRLREAESILKLISERTTNMSSIPHPSINRWLEGREVGLIPARTESEKELEDLGLFYQATSLKEPTEEEIAYWNAAVELVTPSGSADFEHDIISDVIVDMDVNEDGLVRGGWVLNWLWVDENDVALI